MCTLHQVGVSGGSGLVRAIREDSQRFGDGLLGLEAAALHARG